VLDNTIMNRIGFIGSSDAKRIIEGDWLALYEEKVGIRQPEDLRRIFRVQLGKYTEAFHLDWLIEVNGMSLVRNKERIKSIQHPWMQAELDAWWQDKNTFVELKHSNERASPREITETYLPQLAHVCAVTGVKQCYISTIPGNDEPFLTKVEPTESYIEELVSLERSFWWYVENKIAPEVVPTGALANIAEEVKKTKVDGFRYVDMTGSNAWAAHAGDLINYQDAARAYDAAKERLKEMVEPDVGEASGHGVTIKRDKRGALRFTIKEAT
jgi:hypothetical protein